VLSRAGQIIIHANKINALNRFGSQ
jgi:hypothetical protein